MALALCMLRTVCWTPSTIAVLRASMARKSALLTVGVLVAVVRLLWCTRVMLCLELVEATPCTYTFHGCQQKPQTVSSHLVLTTPGICRDLCHPACGYLMPPVLNIFSRHTL